MSELNFSLVVLDGANIIHSRKKNDTGKWELTLEPKRLLSAIEHCEGKGWKTIAALKYGTYWYAETHPNELEEGDFEILKKMINEGKILLVHKDDEDIYWIDFALEEGGYIITGDSFKDRRGEERERTIYPDHPWVEIDRRTLKYEFMMGKFICPDLPRKPDSVPDYSVGKLEEEIVQLRNHLEDEKAKNRALTAQLKANIITQTDYDDEIVEVFENLLGGGEEIATTIVHNELAKSILELSEDMTQWPPNWAKNLKEKLGFPRTKKFTSFFEDISQIVTTHTNHRIEFNHNRTRVKYAV